ncbi:halocyanin domain-containing protein [Natronorarus salvus]|uniref:halocyanin domain-containing protein n=1 Tax=Natronorarus salvus TaxID=3117733 RepID=UPI002F2667A8
MTEETERFSRRTFLIATGAGAAAGAGATPAAAQEDDEEEAEEEENGEEEEGEENGEEEEEGDDGEEADGDVEPDWPSEVEEAPNFDGTTDQRGEDEVQVTVGAGDEGLSFDPPAIWIDEGATVVWEWSGAGGAHNVSTIDGDHDFESDTTDEEGFTFEETFEESGITAYECTPHAAQSMFGGVAVGDDIDTVEAEGEAEAAGGGGGVPLPDSARALGVATVVAAGSTLGLAYVFMKYGGDYEER